MFGFISKRRAERLVSQARQEAVAEYKKEKEEQRRKTQSFFYEKLAEGPVIGISNEHENLVIGFIERIDTVCLSNDYLPIIKDYVSGTTVAFMGRVMGFTEHRFNALNSLTPEERVALIYGNMYNRVDKEFTHLVVPEEEMLTDTELTHKLRESGFYDKMREMKNKNTSTTDTLSV